MRFPLSIEQLRMTTHLFYSPGRFPSNDDPVAIIIRLLQQEGSFLTHNEGLYVDWGKLQHKLNVIFGPVLEHDVDDIFNTFTLTTMFHNQNLSDRHDIAFEAVIQALEQLAGYQVEIPDRSIALSFQDLEQSWNVYSKNIASLPSFHGVLRDLLGQKYQDFLNRMDEILPFPNSDDDY